jgi:hypothetical protein
MCHFHQPSVILSVQNVQNVHTTFFQISQLDDGVWCEGGGNVKNIYKLNTHTLEEQPRVFIGDEPIKGVQVTKASWSQNWSIFNLGQSYWPYLKEKSSGISAMKKIKDFTDSDTLMSVYYGLVQPHFDHYCQVWNSISRGLNDYKNFTTDVPEL